MANPTPNAPIPAGPPPARERPERERERPGTPDAPEKPDEAPRSGSRRWIWIVAIVVVLLAVFLLTRSSKKKEATAAAARAQAANRSVPVLAVAAHKGDIGAYLTGLGTVTAVNTVTVRSRVDGQLIRIAFVEGQLVREGDLLAEIDPRPFQVQLMQAEGQRGKDEAALRNARLDLARYETLAQSDSIPRQQLDTQKATVSQAEATLKTDEGQIESAKLNLVYARITAPITGRVGLKLVDAGNIIHANDPNGVVVITQLQPITVLFTIPADQLPRVSAKLAAGAKLGVEAWDRDLKNKLATGTLLALDNQIDPTTGTVKLKALFPNETNQLFSNQFVNARLLVDTVKSVVLVPTAAIQRSPQSTFVWVVKPDQTVELRNVSVQLTEGDQAAIATGLAEGERVVVDGVDKLQPGSKVAVGTPGAPGGAGAGAKEPGRPGPGPGAHKGKGKAAS
jgi:multidrug efflux system membrane fusion protein